MSSETTPLKADVDTSLMDDETETLPPLPTSVPPPPILPLRVGTTTTGHPADTKYNANEELISITPPMGNASAMRIPPAYSSGADVPPHTAALLELRCHVAALVSLSSTAAAQVSGPSTDADGRETSWPTFKKRRSIQFSLPTTRNIPFLRKVGNEDPDGDANRAEYRLPFPFEVPVPSFEPNARPNSVAYQYHSNAVLACMRKLATVHPSLDERSEWALRADFYEEAGLNLAALEGVPLNFDDDGLGNVITTPPSTAGAVGSGIKKDTIIGDIGKGVALIVGVPIVIGTAAGVAGIAAAGAVLYGTGKTLVGLGRAMTCGKLG